MHLDCSNYPRDHLFAELASEQLGMYVRVALFTDHHGRRMFRMIVDPEINRQQIEEILTSTIKDELGTYEFAFLETLAGPVVDKSPHRSPITSYIRVTFM